MDNFLILQKAVEVAEKAEPTTPEVLGMGVGVVFAGLICIVILCKIVSFFCNLGKGGKKVEAAPASAPAPAVQPAIENRQEIIAAVCAAAAEELGTDISAIRVLSFKKL